MPAPRKIDRLPQEVRAWLQEELRREGFANYLGITERLAEKLDEAGIDETISKSAVHEYGQEYREFARLQEEAGAWAQTWMSEQGLEQEAQRHTVLFQMVTTLAFKSMAGQMNKQADEIDPRELHFIGRMLKDIMSSSGMREKLVEDERRAQAARLDEAVSTGQIDKVAAQKAREIMGFA